MRHITVTSVGDLIVVHRDNPAPEVVKRRVQAVLLGPAPKSGVVLVWEEKPGHVRWQCLR